MTKTSLKLSKKLAEGGCEVKGDKIWVKTSLGDYVFADRLKADTSFGSILCLDLLWDICIKHAKEFFGEKLMWKGLNEWKYHAHEVLDLLQQNKIQEAEDYIWEHTIFNPKNNDK